MDKEKKINNIKEEHTCDTCKWYNPKLTYIEKEECHGCCSWNDRSVIMDGEKKRKLNKAIAVFKKFCSGEWEND